MNVSRPFLPFLIVLFVGSGCAALIYEIVWFQMLELVIGSSAVSLGVLLATFMGGMCLGSLFMPRLISRAHHPLRVYAYLELGVAVAGLLLLFAMPLVGSIYTSWAGPGVLGMIFRGVIAGVCLLPPTFLMGATLPVISRWVETTPEGVSWLGFFYGGNIGGAVIGCLVSGFYLLRLYDVAAATYVAAAINVMVAALALTVASVTPFKAESGVEGATPNTGSSNAWIVYVVIALSGMTALSSEVIWTRFLSLLFGATVYTFALVLAVFLFGLGIGSGAASAMARSMKNPRAALAWCQMLLCGAMAWAAYELTRSLPYWPVDLTLSSDPWLRVRLDIVRCLWAVLPAAVLWGASFPLALASVASKGQDGGRMVGAMYAANTVGAILGSVGASLILVQWIGSQRSQQVLIAMSAIAGLLMLAIAPEDESKNTKLNFALTVLLFAIAGGLLASSVPAVPSDLVAYGRFVPAMGNEAKPLYVGEGLTASVAVFQMPDGVLTYHNAGKTQASSDRADMRFQRMLGHLTTLVPANPQKFLVVGFGAGITAGAVSIEPQLQSETIVEIEPLAPRVVAGHFSEHNFDVARNPRVDIRIDDGRHFLLTTKEKFDGITSDPLDPWVKGAAALYTKEFFEMMKAHLAPGGVCTQWVAFYESDEATVKSAIATFFEVFPHGAIFANTVRGSGYDMVLLGQADPIRIDVDKIQGKLDSPEYARVAQSLREIGFYSATDLLATYASRPADLQGWLKDAIINRDRNLRLQYLAGMNLNRYRANDIYLNMVAYGPYMPDEMFTGSEARLTTLRRAIAEGLVR